jgi:hypothetical protein
MKSRMQLRHAAALALVGWYLMVPSAKAQQPTPVALADPNWCPGVPAAPPPPGYEHRPELWTQASKECSRPYPGDEGSCADVCIDARRRWELKKEGRWGHLQPETNPSPVTASSFPGWYLMTPPLGPTKCSHPNPGPTWTGSVVSCQAKIESQAPLRQWKRVEDSQEFEHKADCERAISNDCHREIEPDGTSSLEGDLCDAECVATDDPRLKEK